MQGRRRPGRKERRRAKLPADKPSRKFVSHPLYGKVPLIPFEFQDQNGKTHTTYQWDPNYEPDMPRWAVRGDIRKQNLCFACHTPKYFYVDEHKTCVQCGVDFVFAASEQKFWYETLGFYGTSIPIRCAICRRKKRTESTLNSQLAAAKSALKKSRRDPALLLNLAEVIILLREMTGHGDLSEATSAARAVRKIDGAAHEALFWEACAHKFSGRAEKAKGMLLEFLALPARSKKQHDLQRKAKEHLAELGSIPQKALHR